MRNRMPPSKTGWPSLNVVIFPPSSWTTLNSDHPGDYWSNSRANFGRTSDFGQINSWGTGHFKWAGWVHHSWRFGHAEALREMDPEMPERGTETSTVPFVWKNLEFFQRHQNYFLSGAIGEDGRNLGISLWPGDKATINRVLPEKIPSAKIDWKISGLDFLGSRWYPPHW